jgi:hypothetical protein
VTYHSDSIVSISRSINHLEDGDSTPLWIVGQCLPHYRAQHSSLLTLVMFPPSGMAEPNAKELGSTTERLIPHMHDEGNNQFLNVAL